MLNLNTLLFVINTGLFFTILWGITNIYTLTSRVRKTKDKSNIFECGFNTINNVLLNISLGALITSVLLFLYEIEFLLLIPFIYIYTNYTLLKKFILLVLLIILITFVLDNYKSSIYWNYVCLSSLKHLIII